MFISLTTDFYILIVKIVIFLYTTFRMEIWTRTPLWFTMPFTCSLLPFIKSAKFRQVEKNEIHILHFYSFLKGKKILDYYRAFHGFGQVKFAYCSSVLGSTQFMLLPQLPLKTLNLKVVKIDSKVIISLQ